MSKRKPKVYNPTKLLMEIQKWNLPFFDKKHNHYIFVEGRARSNQTRIEHIVEYGHNLNTRDLGLIPIGINSYFDYKKDPVHKKTFNYYIRRGGKDKGFIKVSVMISDTDKTKAWIKTIFITYKLK